MIVRSWSLPALDAHQLAQIITHVQALNQEQESAGTRDLYVVLNIGLPTDKLDLLPDLPWIGHISQYKDMRLDPSISAMTVDMVMLWTGIDSGAFTQQHYDTILAPLDRMTTGQHRLSLNLAARLSILTTVAASLHAPKEHRHVVVGNHSNEWFDTPTILNMSREFVRRVQDHRVFWSQLLFSHRASQWYRNKGQNALGWRDYRVLCDDWIFCRPFDDDLASRTTSLETFHRTLPWSTVPGTDMRLETFITPDLEGRPPPHERTPAELRALYPEPGVPTLSL